MRLLALVALLLLTPASLQAQGLVPSDEWSQFRGTPGLTGHSSSQVPQELKVRWTYDCGDAIQSSAAILNGKVFVGSISGELSALDLESGNLELRMLP